MPEGTEVEILRNALQDAKALLQQQDEALRRISEPAMGYGLVIEVSTPWITISTGDKLLQVHLPTFKVKVGDTVTVQMDTMQIIGVHPTTYGGTIQFVKKVIDTAFVEIEGDVGSHVVLAGACAGKLSKGDRVLIDRGGFVVLRNFGKEDDRFRFEAATNISWTDIGGLEFAKKQMIEAVELPHQRKEIFAFYKKKPTKGILLYGPPGCGKTMLGKATATSLAKVYGSTASTGFLYVKGPEILERYVGVAEATIRQIFARARAHKAAHGYPAVVFVDEADAILGKRGTGISSDIERTIVPMFLTEMDGLEESGALVILATNRPDVLDPAVVRDGRIDRKVKIDRPDQDGAAAIFGLNLQGIPLANGYTKANLAKFAAEQVFDKGRVLGRVHATCGTIRDFTLSNIVNGGMIAGIVDQATSLALQRDLEARKPQGLRKEDIATAIQVVERENRDLNHDDAIAEFGDNIGLTFDRVERQRLAA